jgi:diguanylate cyclase (GGDEF)-like protein
MLSSMEKPLADRAADRLSHEVLQLLQLRESDAVPHWAAARLAALCGASEARVLRVFPASAARQHGAEGYAVAVDSASPDGLPALVGADAALAAAISGRSPVTGGDAGRVLVPLASTDEVRYVVELSGASRVDPLCDLLPALLNAYFERLVDAETDTLTRLANRRVLYTQLGALLAMGTTLAQRRFVAIADIDHFKSVNDRFGHLYGDEILIHFARLLRETFRAGDALYRFGGEEFVVVFSVPRHEDRRTVLERFRAGVEAYAFPRVGTVTTSVGFAAIEGDLLPPTTLLDRADNAVYYAKRSGRNRVCEYEELVAQGLLKPAAPPAGGEATLF